MSSNNNNNSGRNKIMVPNAREAMNKFKMEAANEVGVNLKEGYNGELTSKQAGSVGGQMVRKCIPYDSRAIQEITGRRWDIRYRFHTYQVSFSNNDSKAPLNQNLSSGELCYILLFVKCGLLLYIQIQ